MESGLGLIDLWYASKRMRLTKFEGYVGYYVKINLELTRSPD